MSTRKSTARKFPYKEVAAWTAVIILFSGMLLSVIIGSNGEHQSGLAVFIFGLPTFAIQVLALVLVTLAIDFVASEVRNMEWFDRNGAARELGIIRTRIGTDKEQIGDNQSCSRQYLARNLLIAVVILGFFLSRSS